MSNLQKVISEISRVLKPGGVFFYDTLNRTLLSKLVAINISQHWKRWAFAPPNLHVWKMFIRPNELKSLLGQNNLEWKEHRGMGPNVSLPKLLRLLRKRARGRLTYKEMGRELYMVESRAMSTMYMGYAVKYPRQGIHPGYVKELKMDNNLTKTGTEHNEALKTAKNCRHYAMCKIDYLGSGVCPSGLEKQYVSFYPEGRMDLYAGIAENSIPVTEMCVEIADSCNLCGKCDYQCYFVNEMRPTIVMKALKETVAAYLKGGGKIAASKDDMALTELKAIVGDFWATNDIAVRIAYHHDLCPHVTFKMPEYVVMPNSKEEISAVV